MTPIGILGLYDPNASGDNAVLKTGDQVMQGPLHVQGQIETTSGGVKFPDGTIQTTAGGIWKTVLDLDFSEQSSQTIGTDGSYTIGGLTWTKINSTNDRVAMSLTNGSGLIIQPGATSDYYGTARTLPAIILPLTSVVPHFDTGAQIRVWLYVSASNRSANYDFACLGIDGPTGSSATNYAGMMMYNAGPIVQAQGTFNGSGQGQPAFSGSPYASDDVLAIQCPGGVGWLNATWYSQAWSGGAWPEPESLRTLGFVYSRVGAAGLSGINTSAYVGAGSQWGVLIGAGRAGGSDTSFSTTVKRVRVDYK